MNYNKSSERLTVQLSNDFNLVAVREIINIIGNRKELHIDLAQARFVNSEAIIYLHKMMQNGIDIRLENPPKIFFEALKILELHHNWDLKNIVVR